MIFEEEPVIDGDLLTSRSTAKYVHYTDWITAVVSHSLLQPNPRNCTSSPRAYHLNMYVFISSPDGELKQNVWLRILQSRFDWYSSIAASTLVFTYFSQKCPKATEKSTYLQVLREIQKVLVRKPIGRNYPTFQSRTSQCFFRLMYPTCGSDNFNMPIEIPSKCERK